MCVNRNRENGAIEMGTGRSEGRVMGEKDVYGNRDRKVERERKGEREREVTEADRQVYVHGSGSWLRERCWQTERERGEGDFWR